MVAIVCMLHVTLCGGAPESEHELNANSSTMNRRSYEALKANPRSTRLLFCPGKLYAAVRSTTEYAGELERVASLLAAAAVVAAAVVLAATVPVPWNSVICVLPAKPGFWSEYALLA